MKRHALEKLGVRPAKSGDIRVEKLEDRLVPRVPFPHTHDFFHLLLIVAGSGTHEIDFTKHRVTARQLFLMKPGQIHTWQLAPTTTGYILEFTDLSLESDALLLRLRSSEDMIRFTDRSEFERLRELFSAMADEFESRRDDFPLALEGLLTAALVRLLRATSNRARPERNGDIAAKFRETLESSFKREHAVSFYAEALGLSPRALTMQLTRLLGQSPRALIQSRCVLEAKRLLKNSDNAIGEIADQLGFEDANYFSRFFKQHTSMTPAEFRKQR